MECPNPSCKHNCLSVPMGKAHDCACSKREKICPTCGWCHACKRYSSGYQARPGANAPKLPLPTSGERERA